MGDCVPAVGEQQPGTGVEHCRTRSRHPGIDPVIARGGATYGLLGHEVTLVTPHAMAGAELTRTSADWPLRKKFAELGVVTITDSAITEWHGDGATVLNLLSGAETRLAADALVLATCNVAETTLMDELAGSGLEVHAIGDCLAPRRANNSFYEGRRLALKL